MGGLAQRALNSGLRGRWGLFWLVTHGLTTVDRILEGLVQLRKTQITDFDLPTLNFRWTMESRRLELGDCDPTLSLLQQPARCLVHF